MKLIEPSETQLTGKWVMLNGRVIADDACRRIEELTKDHLIELGRDPSGWETLYRDPNDNRLWELIYPQGELQGGGPPQLRCLPAREAKRKYGAVVAVP